MSCTIKTTIASKIGFASHQNAVPVLRELEIQNEGEETLDDLVLELSTDPPFLESKNWRIDSLRAGTTLHITDRDVKLQAGYLAELSESVSGELRLRLMQEGREIAASSSPIEILAKNQWGAHGLNFRIDLVLKDAETRRPLAVLDTSRGLMNRLIR